MSIDIRHLGTELTPSMASTTAIVLVSCSQDTNRVQVHRFPLRHLNSDGKAATDRRSAPRSWAKGAFVVAADRFFSLHGAPPHAPRFDLRPPSFALRRVFAA
jgi:hypothetical protein